MTDAPYDSDDQVRADDADFIARQQNSTTDDPTASGVHSHMVASPSGEPVVGHQHAGRGHWPPQQPLPQAYQTQRAGHRKPWLVVAGVAGLAAMMLAIGVLIGVAVRDRDSGTVPASASATARPGPATYSMKAITNACDLVDRTALTRWASAPLGDPEHEETASSGNFGILNCNIDYGNSTADTFPMNTAALRVRADVMDGSASRTYDHWKRSAADLADDGSVVTSGEFTGIGTQGYWQLEADNFGGIVDAAYVMCVWDGGVAVRVEIDLSREKESPLVDRDELDSVARSQARKVLAGLRQN
jgi:hypothetical protein